MEFRFMRVLIPVDGGLDCREAVRFLLARKSWLESERPDMELLYVQKPLSDATYLLKMSVKQVCIWHQTFLQARQVKFYT